MITAIIMAAGFSRRMKKKRDETINNCDKFSNRNKLLLKIKGKTLIENTLNIVNNVDFSERILIYKDETIKEKAEKMGFRTVFNGEAGNGMSTSLKLGVICANTTDAYMFFVADQPFLTAKTVEKLIKKKTGDGSLSRDSGESLKTIIVPRYNGKQGMPTIFLAKWKSELLKINGDMGGRDIIKNNLSEVLLIDIDNAREGFDIDTWEDYEVIRKNEYI